MQFFSPNTGDSTLLWHQGQAISRAGFSHAALQLAQRLPFASHCINLCNGRLSFMLGLVAAALRKQITLLPPNQTAASLAQLKQQHPQAQVIDDSCLVGLDWISTHHTEIHIDPVATVAVLYTSGSTGVPVAHAKTWGTLLRTGELDSRRFAGTQRLNLVATVPSQHMFGLQTTVLLPLLSQCAIHDSKPFFPADIRTALLAVPAPRALVITPTHLRTCLASGIEFPELQFILSATAQLPHELARNAEALWHTEVLEIYGSTEAGAMATRRTTAGESWQLIPDARLEQDAGTTYFHAGHLPAPLQLSDHVELISASEFRLLGRASDQIKIAGKRAALGDLTQALQSIAGVKDAIVFLPDAAERTAALVVAPDMRVPDILDALAQQVDAVFLPRPLLLVPELPRNDVGKLTRTALQHTLTRLMSAQAHE